MTTATPRTIDYTQAATPRTIDYTQAATNEVNAKLDAWGHPHEHASDDMRKMANLACAIKQMKVGEIIDHLGIADGHTVNRLLEQKPRETFALEFLKTKIEGLLPRTEEILALQNGHPYYSNLLPTFPDEDAPPQVHQRCNQLEATLTTTPAGQPCLVFAEYSNLDAWKKQGRADRENDIIYRTHRDQLILAVGTRSQIIQRLNLSIVDNGSSIDTQHKTPADAITPTQQLFTRILENAITIGATNIRFRPDHTGIYKISIRVSGEYQDSPICEQVPPEKGIELASFLHTWTGAQYTHDKTPVQGTLQGPAGGQFVFRSSENEATIRASFALPENMGGQKLESVSLRVLPKTRIQTDIHSLNLDEAVINAAADAIREKDGLILAVGPTGSGKSTLNRGIVAMDVVENGDTRNRLFIEDPVEAIEPGIVHFNVSQNCSYSLQLKEALRQDPDIIGIGEMRDRDSTSIGIRAALTGHLVFSTLHSNTALGTIGALLAYLNNTTVASSSDVIVSQYDMIEALKLIVAQRLIPRLCPKCGDQPIDRQTAINEAKRIARYAQRNGALGKTDSERKKKNHDLARIILSSKVRNPKGCPHCNPHNLKLGGYKGEIPINEVIECGYEFKRELTEQLALNKFDPQPLQHHIKETLFEAALKRVAAGLTPITSLYI